MSKVKRIEVSQARVGMYVQRLDGSWIDHPFWRKSFALDSVADLRSLRDSGISHLWIDLARGLDVEEPPPVAPQEEPAQPALEEVEAGAEAEATVDAPAVPEQSPQVDLRPAGGPSRLRNRKRVPPKVEDWHKAKQIREQARQVVGQLFADARSGETVDAQSARPVVEDIIASVGEQPGTLSTLARLKRQDDYTFMHSVAVCTLMTTLALELGLNDEQVYEAAMAGLLHDIGKMAVDLAVLNKPGRLTPDEFEAIKRHPVEGHRILQQVEGIGEIALDVCLHHHERIDGNGYPDRLAGDEITLFAKMGTVCDVYDAITSDRPYKKAWEPAVALHHMSKWADGAYDTRVFQAFVKSLGVYPNGSLVRLESGRLAVVVEQSGASLLQPHVKAIWSIGQRGPIHPVDLDLSAPDCADRIVAREDPARWSLGDLTRYWLPDSVR